MCYFKKKAENDSFLLSDDNKIDIQLWADYINQHPNKNIFQTPEFYKIYFHTKNYEPIIVSIEEKNTITGIMLAVIQKEHSGFFGRFSARSIIIGGPLVTNNDPDHLEHILKKYNLAIKGKVIYTQFRNLWDWAKNKDIFIKKGYFYDSHLDILIDVSDLGKLEQGISKNKKRNIVKSTNKGLIFREIQSKNEFEKSVDLVLSTYQRIGLPCVPKEHFNIAYQELYSINRLKIFGAFFNDTMIGVRMELLYQNMIYDWYSGADESESNKYPNDFLIYNILLWSHENGLKTFDFGGAGKPDKPYGVREHKLKFSKNLVEYGRFEYIHNRLLYKLGKWGLTFYRHFNDLFK